MRRWWKSDQVTVLLQTEGLTLAKCRNDIEILITAVEEQRMVPVAPLYGSKLGLEKIGNDSSLIPYLHFEKGIIKLQHNKKNINKT